MSPDALAGGVPPLRSSLGCAAKLRLNSASGTERKQKSLSTEPGNVSKWAVAASNTT